MTQIRIIGLAALGMLVAFMAWSTWQRFHLAHVVAGYERCEKAAPSPDAALGDCPKVITARIDTARRSEECEAALRDRTIYAVRATCGEQVKRSVAERDALQTSLDSATAALTAAGADRDAAVARAEARTTDFNQRTASHDKTIDAAPRLDDGRVLCDAGCLRELAEGAAPRP